MKKVEVFLMRRVTYYNVCMCVLTNSFTTDLIRCQGLTELAAQKAVCLNC